MAAEKWQQKNGGQKNGDQRARVFIFLPAIFLLARSCSSFLQMCRDISAARSS
jgi:hypothetical protein